MASSGRFLDRCLLFDLEINENAEIYAVGAVHKGERFCRGPQEKVTAAVLRRIDALAMRAEFVLGHNIIAHDLPLLAKRDSSLQLLDKPVVDTLYLSPLAFPENPYHRLVKDYKIVRDSVNDPVADAMLAGRIFTEQWESFYAQLAQSHDGPLLYRSFLETDERLAGTARALAAIGVPALAGDDLYEAFSWYGAKYACRTAVARITDELYDGELAHAQFAYICAWLSVAGGNSVLPPWVRHRYPQIPSLLHRLREVGCQSPDCEYCQNHHNPEQYLQRFFGFTGFREKPATADGKSLQREIVYAAATNASLFATLPTGGGKSLCYLLPALMRYQRRNLLTIVLSPLQALMKDQVEGFADRTGTRIAAVISGMQTMPERGAVQEGVRLGDVGILYVSPEQLRNKSFIVTIREREIGAWIFDEAHCLSKWGHDFRPDYLYSIKFIREFALQTKSAVPPVQCFTATAKNDVRAEIIDIVQSGLGLKVVTFEGGHERHNLRYEVWSASPHEKNEVIRELLRTRYDGTGCVVIYCATRRKTERLAEFLQQTGLVAESFHAGLAPSEKRRIQDSFIAGEIPIICATNAFGMGIDKEDVRLVIHADIPGSLENYLQEAGRAGRDQHHAECILIYAEQDIEGQFSLSAASRLSRKEIAQLLKGIRTAAKGRESVVLTPGEVLRLDGVDIDPDSFGDPDTKIKTAIAWLERSGYLERRENDTRVFQGRPLAMSLEEAKNRMEGLALSTRQEERWMAIMALLMERRASHGFSADEIARLTSFGNHKDDPESETEAQRVLRTLDDMARNGLLAKETTLAAFIRYKTGDNSKVRLERLAVLERDLLQLLREEAPDAAPNEPLVVNLRQVNQGLIDAGHSYSTPQSLRILLYGLSQDGKGLAGQKGSLSLAATGGDIYNLQLHRDWDSLVATARIRQQAARVALSTIIRRVPRQSSPSANLLVEFTLEDVLQGLRQDLVLVPLLKDPLAAAERALTFMHEQAVIDLQHGLAVFRQGMTLVMSEENRRHYYTTADYEPLKTHYTERNFQIHVMNEYARRAIDKLGQAMNLISSYFTQDKAEFVQRYFPGREQYLGLATTEESYQKIVDDLHNVYQQKIVTAKPDRNLLVLAGPGSGKTRVVAHRVAYLLRVQRVPAGSILVLCFNRGAVFSLRQRIRDLAGADMRAVTTLTFHGLALRLIGRSLVPSAASPQQTEIDYSQLIRDANALLRGEVEAMGFDQDSPRDLLVGRYSHILVDEYQDIDEDQYELISLIAGRLLEEKDLKLSILAVGDDDQNIYRFRGANIGFIKRFHQDYQAHVNYLVENYRSSANIIAAANQVIAANRDRMKTGHPMVVNKARSDFPGGGSWQQIDHLTHGKVQVLQVDDQTGQAMAVFNEIERLGSLSDQFSLRDTAILAREWQELDLLRAGFEDKGIPVTLNWRQSSFPGLTRIREYACVLRFLKDQRGEHLPATRLLDFLPDRNIDDNIWQANLRGLITAWQEETANRRQPVAKIEEFLYESLADQHRARHLRNGVFLSTVHAVKGLEFAHVFVLGGSWPQKTGDEREEERRLFYVAMTRAKQTLHLLEVQGRENPHAAILQGDFLLRRRSVAKGDEAAGWNRRYEILGMKDLYLDYGGGFEQSHPVHKAIARCAAEDHLGLVPRNGHLYLVDDRGVSVGRLSKAARDSWLPRIESVREVRVLAMVRWAKTDIKEQSFAASCKCDWWEIPVCEVVSE